MKKQELIKIIELVVRKEVKKQMNEIFIKDNDSSSLTELVSTPTPKPVSFAKTSFIRLLSKTPPPIVSYPPSPCGTPPTVSFKTLLSASFDVY